MDRHGHPAVTGDDESLELAGSQRAGVREERDVDDRVVGKGVEQREPEQRAADRRTRGEVPLGRGVTGARADGGITVADDRVGHDRLRARDLDEHTRLGNGHDVGHPERGQRAGLDVERAHGRDLVGTGHDGDPRVGDAIADVRNEDALVRAAARVGRAFGAVPRGLGRVRGGDAGTERDERRRVARVRRRAPIENRGQEEATEHDERPR